MRSPLQVWPSPPSPGFPSWKPSPVGHGTPRGPGAGRRAGAWAWAGQLSLREAEREESRETGRRKHPPHRPQVLSPGERRPAPGIRLRSAQPGARARGPRVPPLARGRASLTRAPGAVPRLRRGGQAGGTLPRSRSSLALARFQPEFGEISERGQCPGCRPAGPDWVQLPKPPTRGSVLSEWGAPGNGQAAGTEVSRRPPAGGGAPRAAGAERPGWLRAPAGQALRDPLPQVLPP